MKPRVIAVGLDSADFCLLQRFMEEGGLPHIRQLRQQSTLVPLETQIQYADGTAPYASTEGNWVMFQTGMRPSSSGYWETVTFDPQTYRSTNDFERGGYDYREFAPFYALGDGYRVATFDVPVSAVVPQVNGKQIVGWGGHFPYVVRGSQPAALLKEVNKQYGKNKVLFRDHGVPWSKRYRKWLEDAAIHSIQQRERICFDLLQAEPWDLFVTVLGETHSAVHDLWAASDKKHPLHSACQSDGDALRRVFEAVDQTVGRLADLAGPETNFVLFSVHGIQANATDLPCLFFLSEVMYRLNFPGKAGIAFGNPDERVPPPVACGMHWYWFGEMWRRRHSGSQWFDSLLQRLPAWMRWNLPGSDLRFPFFMDLAGPDNGWMPAMWYRPAWPKMRAFAIPAFADGHVRINVKGREAKGLVLPNEYEAECDRISEKLLKLRDGRTGRRVVKQVYRTRQNPLDDNPRLPPADLIVQWDDQIPFDTVESPDIGRIGPVPYFRTGGHRAGGFAMVRGPGISAGALMPKAEVFDLPATILRLLGAPIPARFEGESFLERQQEQARLVKELEGAAI